MKIKNRKKARSEQAVYASLPSVRPSHTAGVGLQFPLLREKKIITLRQLFCYRIAVN